MVLLLLLGCFLFFCLFVCFCFYNSSLSNRDANPKLTNFIIMAGFSATTTPSPQMEGRKEGNVLFNNAPNTFYLRLYGVRHMVKNHSDSESETRCRHMCYSFQLAVRVLLYVPFHKQNSTAPPPPPPHR